MRWDLIKKFEVLKKNTYARAVKSFDGKEDFFSEHYPLSPVVPEPLFIEMIAQAGGVLYGLGLDFEKEVILAKIEEAKFHAEIAPPCEFIIEAKIDEEREGGAWISGTVRSGTRLVAEAKFLLAAVDHLAGENKKIVFNDHFLKTYDILAIAKKSEGMTVS